jgi:16S rRNA (guanine527-N7)-methyltransferase
LPGVVLAAMRPDLHVVLLEPMERRATWLQEVISDLGLTSAEVLRGRAEELHGRLLADVVTARAVAPMDRLAAWTLPLLRAHGVLLAMKGSRAADEVAAADSLIRSLGGAPAEVLDAPTGAGFAGTSIVRVVRERVVPISTAGASHRKPASGAKKKPRAREASPTRGPAPAGAAKRPSGRG